MKRPKGRIRHAFGYPNLIPSNGGPKILHSVHITGTDLSHRPDQEVLLDFGIVRSQPYVAIITRSGRCASTIVFMVKDLGEASPNPENNPVWCTAHRLGLSADNLVKLINGQVQLIPAP